MSSSSGGGAQSEPSLSSSSREPLSSAKPAVGMITSVVLAAIAWREATAEGGTTSRSVSGMEIW